MQQGVEHLTVAGDEAGQRLDNYLLSRLKGVPKSALYRVIRKGEVRVNRGRCKPDRKLGAGDVIRVPPLARAAPRALAKPSEQLAQTLGEAVLYDEDGLLVVNKPSGLAVHGGSGINLGLIEALRQLPGNGGFLELIHRLDRETSGCVMIARKRSVLKFYQQALRERTGVDKSYLALVQGEWPEFQQSVSAPLQRLLLPSGERVVRVSRSGKAALTRFSVEQRYAETTLVQAHPVSGRTHQIRVHAKHIGCPLVGDLKYGDTPLNERLRKAGYNRLFLHAYSLKLKRPTGQPLFVEAPLPAELSALLAKLK